MPSHDADASASFLARIREALNQLPPTEQRLGRFILDFPGELASYSASELAHQAGVSNASVTRFVRRLGYASYEEARRHARDQRSAGSPLFLAPRTSGAAGGGIAVHAQAAHDNIAATLRGIDEAELDAIAQALVQARAVWFLGFRNNRSFAAYLRWQLAQVLPRTQVLPGPGETLAEYAVDIAAGDVLVVFALRRSPAVAAAFARRATQAGAQVVFVTEPSSAEGAGARWVLQARPAASGWPAWRPRTRRWASCAPRPGATPPSCDARAGRASKYLTTRHALRMICHAFSWNFLVVSKTCGIWHSCCSKRHVRSSNLVYFFNYSEISCCFSSKRLLCWPLPAPWQRLPLRPPSSRCRPRR